MERWLHAGGIALEWTRVARTRTLWRLPIVLWWVVIWVIVATRSIVRRHAIHLLLLLGMHGVAVLLIVHLLALHLWLSVHRNGTCACCWAPIW